MIFPRPQGSMFLTRTVLNENLALHWARERIAGTPLPA